MDDDAHRVTRGDRELSLSPTEYNLLRYLLVNQGRVVSKAQVLDHVWQYDYGGDGGIVETYIGYLRKKIDTTRTSVDHNRSRCRLHVARVTGAVRGLSLRARVVAAMSAVAFVLVIVATVITTTTRAHLLDQVDNRLASIGNPGPGLSLDAAEQLSRAPDLPERFSDIPERVSDMYMGVVRTDDELVTVFASNLGGGDLSIPDIDPDAARGAASRGNCSRPGVSATTVCATGCRRGRCPMEPCSSPRSRCPMSTTRSRGWSRWRRSRRRSSSPPWGSSRGGSCDSVSAPSSG